MGSANCSCGGLGVGSGVEMNTRWRSGCIMWWAILFSAKNFWCKSAIVVGGAFVVARYCSVWEIMDLNLASSNSLAIVLQVMTWFRCSKKR